MTLSFTVDLSSRASRELGRLPREIKESVSSRIEALADNPFPSGVVKLRGLKDAYRVRVGRYRILFRVVWEERGIVVFRIAPRGRAYKP